MEGSGVLVVERSPGSVVGPEPVQHIAGGSDADQSLVSLVVEWSILGVAVG